MKTFLTTGVVSILSFTSVLAAGPFGFEQGASPSDYGCEKSTVAGLFRCSAPKPHPAFETYAVQAEDGVGVCAAKGIGKTITTPSDGSSLRSQAEEIASQIASTYGNFTKSENTVTTGSIWSRNEDWTMASLKNELFYFFFWKLSGEKVKNNVETIIVSANASQRNAGYSIVEFSFANKAQCDDAKNKREAGSF